LRKSRYFLALGELLHGGLAPAVVHVGQRDDILAGAIADVPRALAPHADPGKGEFFMGRLVLGQSRHGKGNRSPGNSRGAKKVAATDTLERSHDDSSSVSDQGVNTPRNVDNSDCHSDESTLASSMTLSFRASMTGMLAPE